MAFRHYFPAKKTLKIAVIIGILSIFFISLLSLALSEKNNYSYTKAICNSEKICRDYEIVCQDKELVSMSYLGAAIYQTPEWQDPRKNESFCN